MGLFSTSEDKIKQVYENEVKPLIRHDGKVHIILINSFSKFANQNFGVDEKYTSQIDGILDTMQKDGLEIINVKFDSLKGQGLSGTLEGFHTLITYK